MSFLSKLVGIGLVAGAAVAAVKLIEKVWPQDDALDDVVYTVETGEFPLEDGTDAEDAPGSALPPFRSRRSPRARAECEPCGGAARRARD